ncbi:preprotein translocase subunit SecA [Dictyoglomus thermophilum]|uniref:Protein translocase subunit SecA n=2 Tax=Dictyoglomus thermophilum TaxID=14 RepID=B5YF16_DICT6|nr:preprotein translocase subunit SecA [Dictyoglomus thermophilum]ACI19041.1 preprotein translocase, SecA subunit [Dictyoglomus thermophilum H-6-12]MCX7719958.1 preprotein translocase subunit SecA [Dictyoglomus thermophilum]TYT22595.1 preprotein translocase subunit SecA [Dictyoglomus thermophilum]
MGFLSKLFDSNARTLKKLEEYVKRINALEPEISKLSDEDLKRKTPEFKQRLERGESLDDLLVEAFAVVREVAKRTIGMRHFDVQLMGGIVLHQGKIAEMQTGEGKTLVATLPAYLNALEGKGVHIVTVNDYLAKRDRYWMGPIYEFLGLEVGLLQNDTPTLERRKAYMADITYGTNNEFGFDYLRDNIALSPDQLVQRELNYAIVDEVDSILIDEARTPLIISGPAKGESHIYKLAIRAARYLKKDIDYTTDEKTRTVSLTEEGLRKAEKFLGVKDLYDFKNMDLAHALLQCLKALNFYHRDRDYIVKDGEVIIVDEFTGRLMFGRRYSDGLHQAIEAKEGVRIREENVTLATISIQNYFRMYKKLAGMTGTAATEEEEFVKIYGLEVVVIPPNKPLRRINYPDVIFRTEEEKFEAVVKEIEEMYKIGRPVLVGTTSIEKSERLSKMLKKKGIPHNVLNAKYHEKEAEIIAKAGQKYAVTIATNMAGRGTDIVLGEGVAELGGLHVIGTERHESRRIDNQLRGRAGRQGDPGSSRFYLSLEDDLLRLFGGDQIKALMERLGMERGQPIESPLLTRIIENSQAKVERMNFEIRKQLLEYDDVLNTQRDIVYKERRKILLMENLEDIVQRIMNRVLDRFFNVMFNQEDKSSWKNMFLETFGFLPFDWEDIINEDDPEKIREKLENKIRERYERKKEEFGEEMWKEIQRIVLLYVIDKLWIEHLNDMDALRDGIGLRAIAHHDPLVEYKKEAYQMFQDMVESFEWESIRYLFNIHISTQESKTTAKGRRT